MLNSYLLFGLDENGLFSTTTGGKIAHANVETHSDLI